jgi:hypothetical protein
LPELSCVYGPDLDDDVVRAVLERRTWWVPLELDKTLNSLSALDRER